jgi:hypothetical protein
MRALRRTVEGARASATLKLVRLSQPVRYE